MISFSCDRCRCPLETPLSCTHNSLPTLKEAKKGVELLLPTKSSVGYAFVFTHLCDSCLTELSVWRKGSQRVEHTSVDDR